MISVNAAFSHSYASARRRFVEAAEGNRLKVVSHKHRTPGRENEALAMDVALDGIPDAEHLVVISSGVHGVEGFCGSGAQVYALHDSELRAKARELGVALLYVHAVNPYGFSHIRRVTQENVDLNRNFLDFSQPLPVNLPYRSVHALLLPHAWPPKWTNKAQLAWYGLTRGKRSLQTAVSAGQYEFDNGLFYGGKEPTWSNTTLRAVVREYAARAQRVDWIDLHTGLGPCGKGERILSARNDEQGLADAKRIWGPDITSFFQDSSVSATVTGAMLEGIRGEIPKAHFNGISIEFGTRELETVFNAMRAEQWLQINPRVSLRKAQRIRREMVDAFFVDTNEWKDQVVQQSREAIVQAITSGPLEKV